MFLIHEAELEPTTLVYHVYSLYQYIKVRPIASSTPCAKFSVSFKFIL